MVRNRTTGNSVVQGSRVQGSRVRRWVRTVVGAAVATLVFAACEAAPPPPQTLSPATGCHVGLLGDSLSVRVEPRLPAALARLECTQVWVDAVVGRRTGEGVAALEARVAAGQLPAVLVVGLGTNDRYHQAEFPAHVDSVMRLAAGRPVVWIEVAHNPIKANLNGILRRKAEQYTNLSIMEWDAQFWANPDWRRSDDIHVSDLGADHRARLIAESAASITK